MREIAHVPSAARLHAAAQPQHCADDYGHRVTVVASVKAHRAWGWTPLDVGEMVPL